MQLKDNNNEEESKPFNHEELELMFDSFDGYMYYFCYLMFYTGIRPGEIIALRWDDIDFKKKRIAVDKTIVNGKVGDVKTLLSIRYVDILPQLEKKLLEWKKEFFGICDNVFYNSSHKTFYSHDIININFKKRLKEIGIKERSLYTLRHTFASHMISNMNKGIDILWVSRMLGHKDISITLQVYAKYIKENDAKRINKIKEMGMNLLMFDF